jgi:DNA repair exonuclease SbcCD ATPase subunit
LPKDDFYTPTDVDALRMENELLAFEVRFLRTQLTARVQELERSEAHLREQLEDRERQLEESERRLKEFEHSAAHLRAEAERAEQDIVLLLRRLASSPFGWFFATKQNFRILEQRYLGDGD